MVHIYCDESCHLEFDKSNVMALGGIACDITEKERVYKDIRNIKQKHGLSTWFEIKWTKISKSKIDFYKELIDYFFENDLSFRAVVASGKEQLNHNKYNSGSYDIWYYKMYFLLLDPMIAPVEEYRVFIDIKDTLGGPKVKKLNEVLCNNIYDFKQEVVKDVKQINSKESEIVQLVDLFIGALTYYHRGLNIENTAKAEIVKHIIDKYNIDMDLSTNRNEKKFNIFIWEPRR